MDIQDEVGRDLRSVSLIAAAVIASLVIYLGLVEIIRATNRPFRGLAAVGNIQWLRYAAFGGAVAIIVLVRVLRPLLLRKRPGEDEKTSLRRLQRASVVTLVLGEVPGTLGLGLFLLGGYNLDFYVLLFASLVLVFMYFPRRAVWEEWLQDRP